MFVMCNLYSTQNKPYIDLIYKIPHILGLRTASIGAKKIMLCPQTFEQLRVSQFRIPFVLCIFDHLLLILRLVCSYEIWVLTL